LGHEIGCGALALGGEVDGVDVRVSWSLSCLCLGLGEVKREVSNHTYAGGIGRFWRVGRLQYRVRWAVDCECYRCARVSDLAWVRNLLAFLQLFVRGHAGV
jgi:hypothetical protein